MESFFGRMKTECFHGKSFTGIDELEKVINDYVRYYNEERIPIKIKRTESDEISETVLKLTV